MSDKPPDRSFKACESGASSSSSPDKKRSRFSASSPASGTPSDDGIAEKTPSQAAENKSLCDQKITNTIPSWVGGTSPAKFISLEELVKMNDCIEKMNIVHKIATDPDCKVEDFESVDPLYVCVKSNMRRAYWDLLREDLAKEPPDYRRSLSLLEELRQLLACQLEGDHLKSFLAAVDDILDMDKLKALAEIGGLNFETVLKAVLSVIERVCAPIRDELVENLKEETDVVKLFEGLFSLVDFMQIDMTNFKLSQNRQMIRSYSAQIEFEEFKKLVEIDGSCSDNTKRWLSKILDDFLSSSDRGIGQESLTRTEVNELIVKLYLALLTANRSDSNGIPFPETLKLDEKHIDALSEKFLQLELTLSAVFISANLVGKNVCEGSNFKSKLKRDLVVILNDVNWSSSEQKLDYVYVQCEQKCSEAVNGWDDKRRNTLRGQVNNLCKTDDPIRAIARQRLCSFIGHALLRRDSPLRIPPGLSTVEPELAALTSRFYAIAVHNWNGFGRFYGQLLDQLYEAKRNSLPH